MHLFKSFVLLLVVSLLLSACSSKLAPLNPPSELTALDAELKPVHRWGKQLGQGSAGYHLKLRTLVDGERVFAANHAGRVEAYASRSGERLWRIELNSQLNTGPADAGEMLLFGGMAEVIAVRKDDGQEVWRSPVSSEVLALPAWHRQVVVVHGGDGNIIGLDARSGEQRWIHRESVPSLSLRGTGTPLIVGDDGVVVGTASGKLVALGLQDGKPVWEAVIATARGRTELERIADVDADLALVEAVVYASSYQGVLSAISLGGGQILWNRDIASATGIVADREQLYVSASDGTVWALARSSGATMWRQPALQYRRLSAPVQQGNYLILGDYDGYLHWLHKEDGRLVARTRVRDWREHSPLPSDDEQPFVGRPEDRAVLMAPAVSGNWVYALDKRGVLDVYEVSPVESSR